MQIADNGIHLINPKRFILISVASSSISEPGG